MERQLNYTPLTYTPLHYKDLQKIYVKQEKVGSIMPKIMMAILFVALPVSGAFGYQLILKQNAEKVALSAKTVEQTPQTNTLAKEYKDTDVLGTNDTNLSKITQAPDGKKAFSNGFFALKIPNDWRAVETQGTAKDIFLTTVEIRDLYSPVFLNNKNEENRSKMTIRVAKSVLDPEKLQFEGSEPFDIGGVTGYRQLVTSEELFSDLGGRAVTQRILKIKAEYNENTYTIISVSFGNERDKDKHQEVIDEILKTFSFTGKLAATPTPAEDTEDESKSPQEVTPFPTADPNEPTPRVTRTPRTTATPEPGSDSM